MPYVADHTSIHEWVDGLTVTDRNRLAGLHDQIVALRESGPVRPEGARLAALHYADEQRRAGGKVDPAAHKVMQLLALAMHGLGSTNLRRTSQRLAEQ